MDMDNQVETSGIKDGKTWRLGTSLLVYTFNDLFFHGMECDE
jgi:hypothetical protein